MGVGLPEGHLLQFPPIVLVELPPRRTDGLRLGSRSGWLSMRPTRLNVGKARVPKLKSVNQRSELLGEIRAVAVVLPLHHGFQKSSDCG